MMLFAAAFISSLALVSSTPLPQSGDEVPVTGDAPPDGSVRINYVSSSGNGCPGYSFNQWISPDGTTMTMGFDDFAVFIGPVAQSQGKPRAENCALHISLQYPGGYQYSIVQATYHGFARLDAGVTGAFYSSYFFSQSASKTWTTLGTVNGPTAQDGQPDFGIPFTKVDTLASESFVWSPCGATGLLNINNQLALSASNTNATGELYDQDGTVQFQLQTYMQWRKCGDSTGSSTVSSFYPDTTLSTNNVHH